MMDEQEKAGEAVHDEVLERAKLKTKIERSIQNKERLKKIGQKLQKLEEKEAEIVSAHFNSGENELQEGTREFKRYTEDASMLLGMAVDSSRREEVRKRMNKASNICNAMEATADFKERDGSYSYGQYKAFKAKLNNPNLSQAELGVIFIDNQEGKLNRRAKRELQQAENLRTLQTNVYQMMQKHPEWFTSEELEYLTKQRTIWNFQSMRDIERTQGFIDKYMKLQSEGGVLKDVDYRRMSKKQFRKYFDNNRNQFSKEFVAAVEGQRYMTELQIEMRKIGADKNYGFRRPIEKLTGLEEIEKSEFGRDLDQANRTIGTLTKTGRMGYKAAELTALGTHETIKYGGAYAEAALRKTGHEKAAKVIRVSGNKVLDTEEQIKTVVKNVKAIPRRAVRGATRKTAGKIKSTKLFRSASRRFAVFEESKLYKTASRFNSKRRWVMHLLAAPFRWIGKLLDKGRSLIRYGGIGLSLLLILIVVLAALSGGSGAASSAGVLVLADDEQYKAYQAKFDECETKFMTQLESIINGYAKTLNKKGQKIRYGVNGGNNTSGNENTDYRSGVTMNYDYANSSNVEDIVACMAVIMQQEQGKYHQEALELLEALYLSSHTYRYYESVLYPCTSACETTHYFCNEIKEHYPSSELRYDPWLIDPKEAKKPTEDQECPVCKQAKLPYKDYAGCTVVDRCEHESPTQNSPPAGCTNHYKQAVYICPGHEHSESGVDSEGNETHTTWTDYCNTELGCMGYWEYYCRGHNHYGCPDGHDIKTCFGHVDITVDVSIAGRDVLMTFGGKEVVPESESSGSEENGEESIP